MCEDVCAGQRRGRVKGCVCMCVRERETDGVRKKGEGAETEREGGERERESCLESISISDWSQLTKLTYTPCSPAQSVSFTCDMFE